MVIGKVTYGYVQEVPKLLPYHITRGKPKTKKTKSLLTAEMRGEVGGGRRGAVHPGRPGAAQHEELARRKKRGKRKKRSGRGLRDFNLQKKRENEE